MIDYGKRDVLGVDVDALDLASAIERIVYFAERRLPYVVSALAVHGVIESTRDPILRAALNRFDLVLPDGQPVRWALNLLYGLDLPDKVPGPTVVDGLLERAALDALPVFFYGSTPETLDGIRAHLDRTFAGRIEMHATPSKFAQVDQAELHGIADQINATGAQICFIGLGCPRQERLTASLGPHLHMPSLAVGAAFDYLAGTIDRAPDALQKAGLEWAFRLSQDPKRLARRYLTTNSIFAARFAAQLAGQKLGRPVAQRAEAGDTGWDKVDA